MSGRYLEVAVEVLKGVCLVFEIHWKGVWNLSERVWKKAGRCLKYVLKVSLSCLKVSVNFLKVSCLGCCHTRAQLSISTCVEILLVLSMQVGP